VDFLPNIDVECLGQTTEACNDPQEDVAICKSKRLKKLPTNKYQEFFMLNEVHRLNSLSKQSDSGESVSSNNLNKTISQNSSTKVPSKSKLKIKLPC
jgi:hypothetical protein